ncbi:hypothetical protein ROS9278_04856 [Roseomonas sp. CECT 9278]|nr:hypothetical protein ROS9278_04856 [Roseomonas sp. CECT 9278]
MVLKKSVQSASHCAPRDARSNAETCAPRRDGTVWDRVIRWLDARSIRARILMILGTSVMLWSGILAGLGALLR